MSSELWDLLRSFVLASDINHSILDDLDAPILSSFSLIFRPFPGRLACFGQYGHPGCSALAGSRWSTSTSKRALAACWKSSEKPQDEKVRFAPLLFTARARDSKVSLLADYTGWWWLWFTQESMWHYKLRRHILRKGCASRNAFVRKRKVLNPDFKESEDAESFERNCQVCS